MRQAQSAMHCPKRIKFPSFLRRKLQTCQARMTGATATLEYHPRLTQGHSRSLATGYMIRPSPAIGKATEESIADSRRDGAILSVTLLPYRRLQFPNIPEYIRKPPRFTCTDRRGRWCGPPCNSPAKKEEDQE